MFAVFDTVQIAAGSADENIFRMPPVFGEKVTGKQVEFAPAAAAGLLFHPEEILDVRLLGAAFQTAGTVEWPDAFLQVMGELFRRGAIFGQVQVLDLPVHDPVCHRVDVVTGHVAAKTVRLDKRRAATHERIGDRDPLQVVRGVERLSKRHVAVFGENESAEQRAGPTGEPFVHGDDRAVVLLDLFFSQGKGSDEGDVEVFFYGHGKIVYFLGFAMS